MSGLSLRLLILYCFHSQAKKVHSPKLLNRKGITEVARIGSITISHLSQL